jgi:hypothetical protein
MLSVNAGVASRVAPQVSSVRSVGDATINPFALASGQTIGQNPGNAFPLKRDHVLADP